MNCRFTIELQLTGNAFGGTSHTLGVHASRDEDGELSFELFDPNLDRLGGNRRIHSLERFEGLLARHIEDNYGHVDNIVIYHARIESKPLENQNDDVNLVVQNNDNQVVEDNDNEGVDVNLRGNPGGILQYDENGNIIFGDVNQ
jgi:hypothetical protein